VDEHSVKQDPLINVEPIHNTGPKDYQMMTHPLLWTTAGCLIIIFMLVCGLIGLFQYFKNGIKISVTTKPLMPVTSYVDSPTSDPVTQD